MKQKNDWQLLREYVDHGSQAAFSQLVEQHVDFVYSTCVREVRDATLAQDVTQVVFLILARKAALLREMGSLSGWLFNTSRFACKNAMREELRRQKREQSLMQEIMMQEIMAEATTQAAPDENWAQLEEKLHDALSSLNADQRSVIFLRFFEGKSVRETGEALGITEKAAERRLARALEKLRCYFAENGRTISVAAVAVLIADNAVRAAPESCVTNVLNLARSVASGGSVAGVATGSASVIGVPSNVLSLSQGVLKAMLVSQIKTGIVASIGFCVMATSTVKLAHFALAAQHHQSQATVTALPLRRVSFHPQSAISPRPTVRRAAAISQRVATQREMPTKILRAARVQGAPRHFPRLALTETSSPAPAEAPKVQAIKPNVGEITIEGTPIAITNGRLIVDVSAFTLPNGKTSLLNPAKPKTILVSQQTVMHVRGKATPVALIDLKPDCFILASGPDKGSGEALPARDIAVWDGAQNGVFQWSGEPQPIVPEEADPADVPPDDTDKNERPNLFPQGDFQKAVVGKAPAGWKVNQGVRARVLEKNGKRWLAISNPAADWGTMSTNVPVGADWQRVRVVAQMKAKNLKRGKEWWHAARLDFNFYDANNNVVRYGRGLNLYESGDWTTLSRAIEVPKNTTRMVLEAGLFFSTGELLLDNIRIEANPPLEAPPLRTDFPEGKFEKIEPNGWTEGFEPWTPNNVQILEEDGNHFARITAKPPGGSNALDGRFALPPEMKRIRVKARIRLRDYVPGKNPWDTAKVNIGAEDEMGKQVGDYLKSPEAKASDDWVTIESVNSLPEGAKILHVQPQMLSASGIFDVDDIEITDASNEDLPSLPITPDLPGGKFEELDEKGWPKGWIKEAGKPETFQIIEEKGNHFLRLASAEPIYAAAKGRFKLPPEWRGLKLSGRVRVKNLVKKPNAQGWETTRVGFIYQNALGARAGGFQQSLELQSDSDWKQLEVKSDIPRDAVYIELAVLLNEAGGIFDVDDIKLEQAQPDVALPPIYEIGPGFPEGSFEHREDDGNPRGWQLQGAKMQIVQEDDNHFLRLTSASVRETVFLSSQFALKPTWKAVRVRVRLRGKNLKIGGHPLDGARVQYIFLNAQGAMLPPIPAPLNFPKDADWTDLQSKSAIPPGATVIRVIPSLSHTSGTLDIDDILIEPANE